MNTFWRNLLTYLISVPTAFLCCSLMRNQLKRSFRRTVITVLLILLITIPAAAWIDTKTDINSALIVPALLLACYIPYRFAVKAHSSKALAVFTYVIAVVSLVSSVSTGIDALFNPGAGDNDITLLYIIMQLVLSTFAAVLLGYFLMRKGVRLIDRIDIPSIWYSTIPMSLVCIFLSMVMTPDDYSILFLNHSIWTYLAAVFLLVLDFITFTFAFYQICTNLLYTARAEERARILEMQKSQFDATQKFLEESTAVRHDFKQIMFTLRGLLQEKDYEALGKYFDDYFESIPQNEVIRFCLNQPLNALLNYYTGDAHDSGIDLKLVIDPLENVHVSDIDLCTIVGNILDNAIAACKTVEPKNRFIQLSVVNEGGVNLFIVESNSFDGTVRMRNNQYLTVKHDGTGLGLSSVTHIAERYGGSADFSNDGSVFYSNVMIPLNNTDTAAEN